MDLLSSVQFGSLHKTGPWIHLYKLSFDIPSWRTNYLQRAAQPTVLFGIKKMLASAFVKPLLKNETSLQGQLLRGRDVRHCLLVMVTGKWRRGWVNRAARGAKQSVAKRKGKEGQQRLLPDSGADMLWCAKWVKEPVGDHPAQRMQYRLSDP